MNKSMFLKKSKGFTLMELVIVLVIIGILATIAVPMYSGFIKKAYTAEGISLGGALASAEKVYYAENTAFVDSSVSGTSLIIGNVQTDTASNLYFNTTTSTIKVTHTATSYIISMVANSGKAKGITITMTGYSDATQPTTVVTGS